MFRWLIIVVATGIVVLAAPIARVSAQKPPTRVFGTVTIDGRPAPAGVIVQAFIRDKVCGEGAVRRVSDGLPLGYVVDVAGFAQTPGCGTDGDPITLTVGGVQAAETGTFATGTFLRLDLTVTGQAATSTPEGVPATATPTATPTAATPSSAASSTPASPATAIAAVPAPGSGESGGKRGALVAVIALLAAVAAGAGGNAWYRRGRGS